MAKSIAMVRDRPPQPAKKVCVVGAGMAGLAAARELRREGHAVTVMEQRGDVGGQWLYDPRTDDADPLGAAPAPVKVHSSMYASVRLMSPRECMGFSDFQFVPRAGAGRDARRFPGHREVYCYLRDFYDAFGLAGVVRLNTKVVRVAMAPPRQDHGGGGYSDVKWAVSSINVGTDGGEPGVNADLLSSGELHPFIHRSFSTPRSVLWTNVDGWGEGLSAKHVQEVMTDDLASSSMSAINARILARKGTVDEGVELPRAEKKICQPGVAADEVFDAVVVANGHYSQPRLPTIQGFFSRTGSTNHSRMKEWTRRQLHSHSYRVPDPFRDEVVVVVGCGESGLDIALELSGVAKEVHLSANKSLEEAMTPAMSKMLANHADMRLHPLVDRLGDDGTVVFADGSCAVADAVIYCTGYTSSIPFLDTAGLVTVGGNRVGPLYEHTFPPALAPSLSFVGLPMQVFAPWTFEAQARWVARALSGREGAAAGGGDDAGGTGTLPRQGDRRRAGPSRARPRRRRPQCTEIFEFVYRHSDLPRMEDWKSELFLFGVRNKMEDQETFRDRGDDDDNISDNVREGLRRWRCLGKGRG
ncbi:hypothetical protein ACP70R_046344 [Stipagrostis hirtigluma subsp. patula]